MDQQRDPRSEPPATSGSRSSDPRFAMGSADNDPPPRDERDGLRQDDVAQIVHDLRDPLATIALEAYVLDRKLGNGDHSDVRSMVARILHNVEFLDRMIQDLLDSCSASDGHFALRRRPTELRALLEQVLDRLISTRDLGRVVLQAPSPIKVSIDELRIQRVVANLIANALKYTPKCSEIVVRLEVGLHHVQVSVSDAGPGVPPAELERIFEKYRRGSSAHTLDGHGLGLYVSKRIIEAHGGRIGAENVPGTGSRFYFQLPAASA